MAGNAGAARSSESSIGLIDWAKPLKLWHILLVVLMLGGSTASYYLADLSVKSPTNWTTPAYQQLNVATGILLPPHWYEEPGRHGRLEHWGQLKLDDGSIFGFTCNPGADEMHCAYSVPFQSDQNIGKRLSIRYFDWPDHLGPTHVIMEMRGIGRYSDVILLGYRQSAQRIDAYHEQAVKPPFSAIVFWVTMAAMAPGLIYRFATGYEAPKPKQQQI